MNFLLLKYCRLTTMLAVSLVLLACSCHVTQANSPFDPHRQKRGYSSLGSDTTTTSTTKPTSTSHFTTTKTTASMGKLSESQCRAKLTECGLVDVDSPEYQDLLEKVIVKTEVDRVREQYRVALEKVKKAMVFLIDNTIKDPSMTSLCLLSDAIKPGKGSADGDATTAAGVGTTQSSTAPLPRCTVSEWSSWSAPLGFGTQERVRVIKQSGYVCPEQLKEHRKTASHVGISGKTPPNPAENTDLVSDNFINDFMRPYEGKPRDLLFVLDSSGSISYKEFIEIRSGIKVLIDTLCRGFGPAPEQNRLAIIQYSSTTRSVLSFNPRKQNRAVLMFSVDNLMPMYEYTCTGDALNLAYTIFNENDGARNYSVHDTLIVTDGQSNCGADLMKAAKMLQQRSNVYALGIGIISDELATQEISSLVSNRNPRHLFSLANFKDFKVMAEKVRTKHQAKECMPIVSNTSTTFTN